MSTATDKTVTVRFDPQAVSLQADIIGPATPTRAGVMTAADKDKLDNILAFTIAEHERLRQLIHFISEGPGNGFATGAFKEVLPLGDPFPASVTWWESAAKTEKIVEKIITRNVNQTPATITWRVYAEDGVTVAGTVVDTIFYSSGVFETTRTRAIF